MVITPTINYASGTWKRKILRLFIQAKRKYEKEDRNMKRKWKSVSENQNKREKGETADGKSSNTHCDQDSDISFMKDTDEDLDTADILEEDWIEHLRRSTDGAMERMRTAKIQCWIKTHRRMKWRLAMRIASFPEERWVMKTAGWNPELTTKYGNLQSRRKTKKKMGRRDR